MKITPEKVEEIARLARLELTENEKEKLKPLYDLHNDFLEGYEIGYSDVLAAYFRSKFNKGKLNEKY